jgi:tetratricopeptide (TPR) repeat protein
MEFDRGVALLHSFEYELADEAFEKVLKINSQCGIAYWGIAMARFRQLWQPPSKDEIAKAQEALAQAAKLEPSLRERAYIHAAQEFYGDADSRSHADRLRAYSAAMQLVHRDFPDDVEAWTFYALSLLAVSQIDNSLTERQEAGRMLEAIFAKYPQHPGVAHYIIHAYDRPDLASLALSAARKYAEIAPSSIHALHMPSHIFADLGLWRESIDSNIDALQASRNSGRNTQRAYNDQLHAIDFIILAATQIGGESTARQYANEAARMPLLNAEMKMQVLVDFPVNIAFETHNWAALIDFQEPQDETMGTRIKLQSLRTIAAARLGNAALARKNFEAFQASITAIRDSKDPELAYIARHSDTLTIKPAAWLDFTENRQAEGSAKLRLLADKEPPNGASMPASEMLGDMLLDMRQPQDALAAYERSLKLSPNRFNSLYGAAHAAELAGMIDVAQRYYRQLVGNCSASNSDRVELAHAKGFLAARANAGASQSQSH